MSHVMIDAGPLIALSHINRLQLLRDIFKTITITRHIYKEVLPETDYTGKIELTEALQQDWIKIIDVDMRDWNPVNPGVDRGEASIIQAAYEPSDCLLVMDDQAGRAEANSRKLMIIGTAAFIGMAKLKGLFPLARPVLYALRESGYFISDAVIESVLEDIGE